MSYQLKRIDPYWHTHPMIPTAVAIGGICGLIGYALQNPYIAGAGGCVAGLAILAATRPVISALLGTLGLFGGLVTFIIAPGLNAATMTAPLRVASVFIFAVFYMILMDALVLVVSVIYNLFAGVVGMGGLRLELDTAEDDGSAA